MTGQAKDSRGLDFGVRRRAAKPLLAVTICCACGGPLFWFIELALILAATPAVAQHEGHMMGAIYPPFGSGTSWLPAVAPMRGFHFEASDWSVMVHGSVFGQFIQEFGPRGNYQLGSINMVTRAGYPQLLQVAQPYRGGTVTDRMHPHELLSEVAVMYDRPHHTQDITHESFGVATIGVFTPKVHLEASVFNGAHPNEVRTNTSHSTAWSFRRCMWREAGPRRSSGARTFPRTRVAS